MSHVTTYLAELHSYSLCAGTSIQVGPKRKKKIKLPIPLIKLHIITTLTKWSLPNKISAH